MPATSRPKDRSEFDIAIICALGTEFDAVEAVCDEIWKDATCGKAEGDPNQYTLGRIGAFHITLVLLPGMGKEAAASGSAYFRTSFPRIELCLLVGICAGYPHDGAGDDIRLGDPIVSTSVVQSDAGRQFTHGIVRKNTIVDNFGRHSKDVHGLLTRLATTKTGKKDLHTATIKHLRALIQDDDDGYETWGYPETANNRIFHPSYDHRHRLSASCNICSNPFNEPCAGSRSKDCEDTRCDWQRSANIVGWRNTRKTLENGRFSKGVPSSDPVTIWEPHIHFGVYSSADQVLRSTTHRDERNVQDDVIAYEMEGAGVWDNFDNVVIIKSVCDYADSHKNKKFQHYAAATAAACGKAFLAEWARGKGSPIQRQQADAGHPPPEAATGPAVHGPTSNAAPNNVFSGTFNAGGNMFHSGTFNVQGGSINF